MHTFNDEATKAGILVGMGGLLPSAHGKRVKVSRGKRTVIDGPFTESKELIAGYVIIDVPSLDEATRWCTRYVSVVATEEADVFELETP